MKQKLTLLLIALVTSMGAWATDVTWESIHGWTQSSGGVGNFKWYGVHTPGDNTITYTMSSIQLKQCAGGDNNTNYLAIATVSPGNSSTIVEANVLAVSSNSIQATTSTLYEYTFTTPVTLTGGTTYYLVFVTANTPADNAYNIQTGRMEVNHVKYDQNFTYGPYSYGNSANNDWWPYFTATLTTSAAITNYNYSCKNLAGYEFCSGTLPQASAPTKDQAPNLGDYYSCQSVSIDGTDVTFTYALTANPLASATTPAGDIATNPKYTTIESVAGGFVYYAEEGGAVKGWSPYDKDGDDAHWIIVGDEANGYKLYNALTGTSKVAVVADGSGQEIQMKDEASNTASLFDIRYISGAYRFYKKGTVWCTNRLSSGTKLIGIHENVNNGSNTVVTRYSKTITYKLKWNGEEKASQNVSVPTGDNPSDYLPWDYAYCNLTCDVDAVTTETSTVNVTMTWDGPFEFSTDYASAKWYYLKLNNKYVYYDTETTHLLFSADRVEEPKALWAFFGNPYNGVKVANLSKGDGYFINNDTPATMETSGFVNNQIGSNAWGFYLQDSGWFIYDDGSGRVVSAQASGYEDRSNVTLKVEPYVVTYNLKFGGSTIATKTVDKVTGDSKDLFPSEWARDFCTYSYEPAEIGNSTTSVDVTMTWNGPFDISADYENAVWYYLAVNGKWGKQLTLNAPNIYADISDVKGLDVGEWAFFGNPYDGFLLSPKAKTASMQIYLSSQEETPAFGLATGSTEKWTVTSLSGTTFTLNCGDKYIVDNSTTMGFKTTALEGSEGTFSVRSYYCQQALDDFADYVGESTDKYFGVKPSSVTNVNNMIAGMPKMTEAQYTEYFTDLYNSFKDYISFNWPETGYYRIKNNNSRDYIGYGKPEGLTGGQLEKTAGLVAITSANVASDYSTVVRLTKVSATWNTGLYTISTQGLNVQGTPAAQAVYTASGSTPVQFKFVVDGTPGVVYIKDSNASGSEDATEGCLHEANWVETHTLNGIVPWTHGAASSKWVAEDATSLTINPTLVGGKYYATLCLPFTVTLSGATAYTLSLNGSKNALTLSEGITEVPAGTPVLLRGDDAEVTASIEYNEDYQAAPLTSTALTGTYTAKSVTGGTDYFLGYSGGQIGFYHWTGSTLGANRAYLEASKLSGSVKGFALNFDDVDAVTDVQQSVPATSEWYDLSGRRVNQPTQGLYIKNGKKVLVK